MPEPKTNPVGPSRDGHQYHEAWVARRALGLIFPQDGLCGIAVEGLARDDQDGAPTAAVEVADATFYYGKAPSFSSATRVEIAQFKYSVARQSAPFRCADAKKTIEKFVISESKLRELHGQAILAKVSYAIYTNRPIARDFADALEAITVGHTPTGKRALSQYGQLDALLPKQTKHRRAFAARLSLHGSGGNLARVEGENNRIIADWSSSNDLQARARLGDLRQLVRNKAGSAGQVNNLIVTVDVLAALDVNRKDELLPAPAAFVDPGAVVERSQLDDFISRLGSAGTWLVHASGGVGKTVFAQSLATRLSQAGDEVTVFDCFGGGAYRSPTDERHLPKRGLMHIVNLLASRGLCDPLLPRAEDSASVLRHSLFRFNQAIETLRRTRPTARLVIVLDAADNAAIQAEARGQDAFPKQLFEVLNHEPLADGLLLIATARTERRDQALGSGKYQSLPLRPFTRDETAAFVSTRLPHATAVQVGALHKRTGGNGRIIANLIETGQALAPSSAKVELDDILRERIAKAVSEAGLKGESEDKVAAFLCAVCVLPPPVPPAELAIAFGIEVAAIESFAADLSPLLEATRHGLIFRDEPTETLVRSEYGSRVSLLDNVAAHLAEAQASSVYAARSLPALLFAMRNTARLRDLAFDERFPAELSGDVAKRAIRLNRVRTALRAATADKDRGLCVELMMELAALVMGDERGETYLTSNPDLTVGLGNSDDMRRLFEARPGGWRGTRDARLAIAYTADGSLDEAYGHAVNADEWLNWVWRQDEEERRNSYPEVEDGASVVFYLLMSERIPNAKRYLDSWKPFYSYLVAKRALSYCAAADAFGRTAKLKAIVSEIANSKPSPALTAALLTVFPDTANATLRSAFEKLGSRLKPKTEFPSDYTVNRSDSLQRGLVRCAARMINVDLSGDARRVLSVAAPKRFDLWTLRDEWHADQVVDWAFYVSTRAALDNREPDLFDCLPSELWSLVQADARPATDAEQESLVEQRLKEDGERDGKGDPKPKLSHDERHYAGERLRERVRPMIEIAREVAKVIKSTPKQQSAALTKLVETWRSKPDDGKFIFAEVRRFRDTVQRSIVLETLATFGDCSPSAARGAIERLENADVRPPRVLIEFVRLFARRKKTQALAGSLAAVAVRAVESDEEVSSRTDLLARLARALLPASKEEASALFARGLSELDALGSGDYDFAWELLNFASKIGDGPLPAELVLRLAKICEVTVYETDKWPWPLTAKAFTHVAGPAYLAQICRWHDRDKVSLDYTLPSALTELIKSRSMPPTDALVLLRLVDPVRMWTWDWHDLLKAVLDHPEHCDDDVAEVFAQIDLAHPCRPIDLDEIKKTLEAFPRVKVMLTSKLAALEARRVLPRRVRESDRRQGFVSPVRVANKVDSATAISKKLKAVDPANSTSIEDLIDFVDKLERHSVGEPQLLSRLRSRVPYAKRGPHIEALIAARNATFLSKVLALQGAKDDWQSESPTRLSQLSGAGIRLARGHAEEILAREWGGPEHDLAKASSLSGDPIDELAIVLAEAAIEQDLEPSSGAWLNLATIVAGNTPDGPARSALERLLASGAARLLDDLGDGRWRHELDPGADADAIAAGVLWFALGSPTAADRWRAAHTVRALVARGRWHIVDRLFEKLVERSAGAFSDQSLPFFEMDAALWFLITAARLAMEHPTEVGRHSNALKKIALDATLPHVGLRQAACDALAALDQGKPLMGALEKVNKPQLKPIPRRDTPRELPWERPDTAPKPKPEFYFDYDFEKTEIQRLGDMFGLPKWYVGDLMRAWIARWSPATDTYSALSGRRAPYRRDGYHRSDDGYHTHGSYLSWHALAVVAGELLAQRPLSSDSYHSDDPWDEFVADFRVTRPDGLWMADGSGPFPIEALHELRDSGGERDSTSPPTDDASLLLEIAGLGSGSTSDQGVRVHAAWSSPDKVDLFISTALVPVAKAALASRALATAPEFHRWLPIVEHDDEDASRYWLRNYAPCMPWIASREQYEKLDGYDPFAAHSAISIHKPSKSVIQRFGLASQDGWMRMWTDRSGSRALEYQAWGLKHGEGDRATRESGHVLSCDRRFLSQVLSDTGCELLVLIKLQRFHERGTPSPREGDDSKFTHSFLVARVDADLKVRRVRATVRDLAAVAALEEHSRPDFADRYRAIANKARRRPRGPN